ncbi:aminodeoxychorismate synthase component I [Ureibacillus sp. FSL E2-3493]|uniref:aminodeoxychorismate synthase component I n=1 Tax=Ureibacillus sp. FSL E2-3493 TaxID=2921367 RepID=UPI003119AF38
METNHKRQPILTFDFASSNGDVTPLTFKNPLKVIVAYTIEEVLPCFQLIQEAIEKGLYAAGYVSYESAPAFDQAMKVHNNPTMPLLWFGIFKEPLHESLDSDGSYVHTKWMPKETMNQYQSSIASIQNAIKNGDTYQTNYTIRLQSQFQGDDIAYFNRLKNAQSSNYCSYIYTGDFSILSASPELFFHLKDNQITTRPMKGTVARGKTVEEDAANRQWLYNSEKNRAENVMIVDLLRNDLSMIAEPMTVQVPKLFQIEQYPTVHQMTSTVTATIKPNTTFFELFKALFPCGSITGAPKISTMDMIASLESTPRDVYCGAIGYITPDKEAIFNVPIRTVVINNKTGQATYGVGGGITWDSKTDEEYEEILAKACFLEVQRPKFELLESILLQNGELVLLDEHLTRLQRAAKYFGYSFNMEEVKDSVFKVAKENKTGQYKLRLLLEQNGKVSINTQTLQPVKPLQVVSLAKTPIDKKNVFYYYKTTNRDHYEYFQQQHQDVFDVLLWNEKKELTEFTNGNVVLEIDGVLWTPPIECGLLAGTFREKLLNEGKIHEKVLTLDHLNACSQIWFINSVRNWMKVEIK